MSDKLNQSVLRDAILEVFMTDSTPNCPEAQRWLVVTCGGDSWNDAEKAHIGSCLKCKQQAIRYAAAAATPRSPWWIRIFHHPWMPALALVAICVVGIVSIRLAGGYWNEYDSSQGLSSWVSKVESSIWWIGGLATAVVGAVLFMMKKQEWLVQPMLSSLLALASLLGGTVYTQETVTKYATEEIIQREELFQSTRWVLLDSAFYWPDSKEAVEQTGHEGQMPTLEQSRLELKTLKSAGFTGICIYGNPQPELLKMAKNEFNFAIVQGIVVHDSKNLQNEITQREIRQAISASDSVDAFLLGYLHAEDVNMTQLQDELAKLRQRTGKPVTPNFLLNDYLNQHGITESGRNLLKLSDFLITDLPRPYSHDPPSGDSNQAAAAVAQAVDELKDAGIPTILSFVGYPSEGGEGFTEENQRKFVEHVLEIKRPRGLGIAFTNGFDLPWKQRLSEVSPWTKKCDGHLGFFRTKMSEDESTATFTAKPALKEFQKNLK